MLELERRRGEEGRRREARQRRRRRQQQHIHILGRPQTPQRRQALGDQVLMRAEGVVGQRLPIGEQRDAKTGRKERQFVGEALCVGRLGGDDCRQRFLLRGMARDQQRVGRAGGAGQRETLAGRDGRKVHEAVNSRIGR
jgi:hypothetical protein